MKYWRDLPPVHVLVTGLAGHKPRGEKAETINSPEELQQLMGMFPMQG